MTEFFTQFHFIRPLWLLLAPVVFLVWWFWRRGEDPLRGWKLQMEPELLEALTTGESRNGQVPAFAVLGAWLAAVIVVAGPTWRPEPNPFAEDSSPLVILLKADASMEQPDPAPSRMERAQLKIADLAEARKGQPLGLIAYAGSSHLVLPPTKDTGIVAEMAGEISPEIMPVPGDRLDLAITKAGQLLAKEQVAGSIVVLADAADGDTEAAKAAHQEAGRPQVRFLAINSPGSSEDQSLRTAARAVGGKVEPITADGSDVEALVRAAARPPVSRIGDPATQVRWEEGGWLLVPVLAILAALAFRRESPNPPKEATT